MADKVTAEELAADGGVMTDVPGVVGIAAGQLENFPANPEVAAEPPMPALPQVTPLDPADLASEPAAAPEKDTPPAEEPAAEPAMATEPVEEPEAPAEPETPAEPEKVPWDKKRQKVQQQLHILSW